MLRHDRNPAGWRWIRRQIVASPRTAPPNYTPAYILRSIRQPAMVPRLAPGQRRVLSPEVLKEWLDGLVIQRQDDGTTVLTGPVVDQAVLHGVIARIRDLGLPLLAMDRVEPEQGDAPSVP